MEPEVVYFDETIDNERWLDAMKDGPLLTALPPGVFVWSIDFDASPILSDTPEPTP